MKTTTTTTITRLFIIIRQLFSRCRGFIIRGLLKADLKSATSTANLSTMMRIENPRVNSRGLASLMLPAFGITQASLVSALSFATLSNPCQRESDE